MIGIWLVTLSHYTGGGDTLDEDLMLCLREAFFIVCYRALASCPLPATVSTRLRQSSFEKL